MKNAGLGLVTYNEKNTLIVCMISFSACRAGNHEAGSQITWLCTKSHSILQSAWARGSFLIYKIIMEEKKSITGSILVKGILLVIILSTIMIIYFSIKLFYIGNTFR